MQFSGDPLVLILTVVAAVLSLVIIAVSVQAILVMREFQRTLRRVNSLSDTVEKTLTHSIAPLANLGGMVQGMKMGLKMLETFGTYLRKNIEKE
jgi:hypothetical protein